MNLNKMLPYLVSVCISAVGLFFIAAGFIGPTFLKLKAPGSHYLLGLSIIFVFVGALASYLTRRGVLKRVGITPEDIRREAVSKSNDRNFLAKVVLEDENDKIRETATERLKEIEV